MKRPNPIEAARNNPGTTASIIIATVLTGALSVYGPDTACKDLSSWLQRSLTATEEPYSNDEHIKRVRALMATDPQLCVELYDEQTCK